MHSKLTGTFVLLATFYLPAVAQTPPPDLRGTWKGETEAILIGDHAHYGTGGTQPPRLSNLSVTLTIDKQEGRRFSGRFASARGTEVVIGTISRAGRIHVADDDGHSEGTLLAPDRLELCYIHVARTSRAAACTEFIRP